MKQHTKRVLLGVLFWVGILYLAKLLFLTFDLVVLYFESIGLDKEMVELGLSGMGISSTLGFVIIANLVWIGIVVWMLSGLWKHR